MSSANYKLPVNYSIRHIIDSILSDIPRATKFSVKKKQNLYSELKNTVSTIADLSALLQQAHIRSYPVQGSEFFARIALLPPELVIADERFKRMCCMPYWTVYGSSDGGAYRRFDRCPGYGRLPGCPPNSPEISAVQEKLDRADLFIVLQTRLIAERWGVRWKFDVLRRLSREIESVLGKGSVIERYGSGPCTACSAQLCLHGRTCRSPGLKTVALESMGICVDRICSDLTLLTGDARWKLTWLRHFGLPQQSPKKWKYVVALAVKLPGR